MPINSASIPALRIARTLRRKRRAEGGGLSEADEQAMSPETYQSPLGRGALNLAKGVLYDLPKKAIEAAQQNPLPGLRREDYTDIPPDTTPDPSSPLGGVGISVPRQGAQPVDPMVGASLETVANGAGMNMPFAKPGTAGIFGGRLAQTANHEALARAESMTAAGVAPEQIWKETGWFKGPDDQWRFEINDAASGYKRPSTSTTIDNYPISNPHETRVGAAFEHPGLYEAYPDLKDMPLQFRPLSDSRGAYIKNDPSPGDLIPPHEAIAINTPPNRYGDHMKQARSTTLHELQHAVQQREGFPQGGSPEEMRAVVEAAEDARSLKSRMAMGHSKEEAMEGFKNLNGRPPHPAASLIAEKLSGEELSRIASDPLTAYRRLYGEVEARNVQTRRDLPPEGRQHAFPRETEDVLPEYQTLGRNRPGRSTESLDDVERVLEQEQKLKGASNEPRPAEAAPLDTGAVAGPSGGGEGFQQASVEAERRAAGRKPLEGLPTSPQRVAGEDFIPGPVGRVHDVADRYMADKDFGTFKAPEKYHAIDPEHSAAIAKAYDEMKHAPNDPAVKNAYEALIKETLAQYQAIKESGLKITPVGAADYPYHGNPREVARDIADNNHMAFFKTREGFGAGEKPDPNHPMLRSSGEKIGDHDMLNNDLFRVVHDYFGHVKNGYGFRAAGEDNAWRSHAAMYSDLARPAMTSETRGQNSWVNYGPHGEKNRTASGADTVYADQKVGLMPHWTMYDKGQAPPVAGHGSPHDYDGRPDLSKLGSGEGAAVYGAGHYLADRKAVYHGHYRKVLSRNQQFVGPDGQPVQWHHVADDIVSAMRDQEMSKSSLNRMHPDQASQMVHHLTDLMEQGKTPKAIRRNYDPPPGYEDVWEAGLKAAGKYTFHKSPGHTYEYAIESPREHFLDWDAPLKDQSEHVRSRVAPLMEHSVARQKAALESSLEKTRGELERSLAGDISRTHQGRAIQNRSPERIRRDIMETEKRLNDLSLETLSGREIYRRMGFYNKTAPGNFNNGRRIITDEQEGYKLSSAALREMGVPGVRYLDQGSRAKKTGAKSYNHVIFDPDAIRLMRKYGVAGIPAAGAAAAASQQDERAAGGRVADRLVGGAIMAPAVMEATRERQAGGSVNAAMDVARSIKRAKGGKVHLGPIIGHTDGRADKVPMEVPDGSYVLTADHCSAMGEGNTLAGFKKLKGMFPKSVAAYKAAKANPTQRASGGRVPILAADGEFVICPEDIVDRYGDLDHGHRILDHWQTTERKNHIATLSKLAPPAQD